MYEPIKVGDNVIEETSGFVHRGKVLEIGPSRKPSVDDGEEAYVRWHKGYSSWVKLANIKKALD